MIQEFRDVGDAQEKNAVCRKFCDPQADAYMIFMGRMDRENGVGNYIQMCCGGIMHPPKVKYGQTPAETFRNFFALREQVIRNSVEQEGSEDKKGFYCHVCEQFVQRDDRPWHCRADISLVNITVSPAPCQGNCFYCDLRHDWYVWRDTAEVHAGYERLLETLAYGRRKGLISPEARWVFASGEITIHPYKKRFLELLAGQYAVFCTNGFLYDEDLAAFIRQNPRARINISLDAGTAETWKKVKGFDNFAQVKANLRRYTADSAGGSSLLELKYIVCLDMNDKEEDYQGFVGFAKEFGVRQITLSRDMRYMYAKAYLPGGNRHSKLIAAAARLHALCVEAGFDIKWLAYTQADIAAIEALSGQISTVR